MKQPEESIALAVAEVHERQSRTTAQVLDDHRVRLIAEKPDVVRVDTDEDDHSVIVYFGLENRSYFLAVRVDPLPTPKIRGVSVEAGNECYLISFSTKYPLEELLAATTLQPTDRWDFDAGSGSSGVYIKTPMPLADGVDDNINRLLDVLEQDAEGVRRLAALSNTFIQVHWSGLGRAMSPIKLKAATIQRIASLRVGLDFDQYVQ
jgi:hypothetical protein